MCSVRVFTSFDLDHDEDLVDRLLVHSREADSGFEIVARSQAGMMTEAWSERVRCLIDRADELIVICGEHSGTSERMSAELGMARVGNKPYFLLWGRRERMCTKPAGARSDVGMYRWTWETLREQIAFALRNARPLETTEGCEQPWDMECARAVSPFALPGAKPRRPT